MVMGGLWESWKRPDGNFLRTVCIVTVGPNDVMEQIHDPMLVIVPPKQGISVCKKTSSTDVTLH